MGRFMTKHINSEKEKAAAATASHTIKLASTLRKERVARIYNRETTSLKALKLTLWETLEETTEPITCGFLQDTIEAMDDKLKALTVQFESNPLGH